MAVDNAQDQILSGEKHFGSPEVWKTFTTAARESAASQPGRAEAFHRRGYAFGGHSRNIEVDSLRADQGEPEAQEPEGDRSIQPFPGEHHELYHEAAPVGGSG